MDKQNLDYIRLLTSKDSKTLSQKALKGAEEVGELAKKVLAYDNASGSLHRFVDRNRVLEEAVDSMIVMLSIAYDLGFSDEEIQQMMSHKTTKWAGILTREGRVPPQVPYEIHITVEADTNRIEAFKEACEEAEVKPILLDLHTTGGPIKDLMTSSVFRGNNREAYLETKRISDALKANDFKVLREKIETIPWHPAAPSLEGVTKMPDNCYFECHFNVLCTEDRRSTLEELSGTHEAHISRNVFKRITDNSFTIMLTARSYELVYEHFRDDIQALKADLENYGFPVEKEIVEFSIYDTNVSHDYAWIRE